MSTSFDACLAQGDGALQCVTETLSSSQSETEDFARTFALLICSFLVFFMQGGFAMLCAGSVRRKNVQNTMLKNLMDACSSTVAYFSVGYAFAFGGTLDGETAKTTFLGNNNFFLKDIQHDHFAFWLFQWAFSTASTTIVAGTLAERCQMKGYLSYSAVLSGFVYPVVAHAIWSTQDFLSANSNGEPLWNVGMLDFAGSGVVHLTGGLTALYASVVLGSRKGRFYNEDGSILNPPKEIEGHSPALQVLGTMMLWFGWYGFNCGSALLFTDVSMEAIASTASLAAVNTTLAGGVGGIISLVANVFWLHRFEGESYFDLKFLNNGALCGLVSIT